MMLNTTSVRRIAVGVLAGAVLVIGAGAPAAAHIIVVDPPGAGGGTERWIGSPALPGAANGKGLIPGGPEGLFLQSPAHDGGLVHACLAVRDHGNGVVDIFGPTFPGGELTCRHGSQPVD